MNEYEMALGIVLIVMISVVMMVRYKYLGEHKQLGSKSSPKQVEHQAALESEVTQLRERVKVLERIAVEKEDSLTQQIEQLRDR